MGSAVAGATPSDAGMLGDGTAWRLHDSGDVDERALSMATVSLRRFGTADNAGAPPVGTSTRLDVDGGYPA